MIDSWVNIQCRVYNQHLITDIGPTRAEQSVEKKNLPATFNT